MAIMKSYFSYYVELGIPSDYIYYYIELVIKRIRYITKIRIMLLHIKSFKIKCHK